MEYDAAYKKKRDILIFIHSKASQSDSEKFLKFIQKITNFTYGRFRKTFKNPEQLQYHLFTSLVFNIFNLDRHLNQIERKSLESLVEDIVRYKNYLENQLKYVDFRGIPRVHRFITLEQSKLFVEPKLSTMPKNSEISNFHFNVPQSNEQQSIFETNMITI